MSKRNRDTRAPTRGSERADAPAVLTADAFSNPLFRLGAGSQSPLEATEYPLTRMTDNYALLNSLYRENWVVQHVCGIIPDDITRQWFTLGGVDPKDWRVLERCRRRTALGSRINEGLRWGRLYGGAAGILLLRGQERMLEQPLELDSILPGTFAGLYIVDRWCGITPEMGLVRDIGDPDFGLPEFYRVEGGDGVVSARIHHSRVIRFTGRELPWLERAAELYWGESEVEALYRDVVKHDNVSENMAALTFRANVDVMEVEGLDQLFSLSSGAAQRRFWTTMQAQAVLQSNFGTRLVNKGDQIHNTQYTFTGLQEVYDSMCLDLSGASRIPMTKLFGRSPAGMNATGESDMRNYYDYVDTLRESKLRPVLERLLPVVCMSELGGVPDGLEISFPPLWTPTAREVAEIAEKKAAAIRDIFQAGLLQADTAQKELKKLEEETGLFGSITEEEIAVNRGKTYKDLVSLDDPLAGLDFGPENPEEFDRETGGNLTVDYNPYRDSRNGRFTSGGGSGKIKSVKMSPKEFERVSSGFFTDHPSLKPGTERTYEYGAYQYRVIVKGPGNYEFKSKKRLK